MPRRESEMETTPPVPLFHVGSLVRVLFVGPPVLKSREGALRGARLLAT
jgi:hypothetical protein